MIAQAEMDMEAAWVETRFDRLIPIIEGKLYAYGLMRLEYPDGPAGLGRLLEEYNALGTVVQGSDDPTSPQERWALRHAHELRDAAAIESSMRHMDEQERQLIELRYFDRSSWSLVARRLHVGASTVYRIRDRALRLVAQALRMDGAA